MLSERGRAWLRGLGLEPANPSARRRFAYPCLDWSERRDHLAGQLADELYLHLTSRGWLRRGEGRAVALTIAGKRELLPLLDGARAAMQRAAAVALKRCRPSNAGHRSIALFAALQP